MILCMCLALYAWLSVSKYWIVSNYVCMFVDVSRWLCLELWLCVGVCLCVCECMCVFLFVFIPSFFLFSSSIRFTFRDISRHNEDGDMCVITRRWWQPCSTICCFHADIHKHRNLESDRQTLQVTHIFSEIHIISQCHTPTDIFIDPNTDRQTHIHTNTHTVSKPTWFTQQTFPV